MASLKDDDIKLEVVRLKAEGITAREIGEMLELGTSTVTDFLREETHKAWWDELKVERGDIIEEDVDELCQSPDWHVSNLAKRLRTAQRTNTQLRKALNGGIDKEASFPEMMKAVKLSAEKINNVLPITNTEDEESGDPVIYEILLSDYQIGKIGQYYNSKLAKKAMARYSAEIMKELASNTSPVKKVIIALLGDLVEDHMKHGVHSATSTDSGLAEQMANAIAHLWKYIIEPVVSIGHYVEVICIAGNHGSSQHKGIDMFRAGLFSYDYVIYKALEGYCNVAGYDNVKFVIPEGCFGYTDIFGRMAVYEHGYFNTCTEKSLEDQRNKRSNQMKRHVEYFRCGDMHHICNFDNGKLLVNGAFFGVDTGGEEYGGIMGFSSVPAQIMMKHRDTKSLGRNTVSETKVVQVASGY